MFTLELKLSVIKILPAEVKSATVILLVETAYGFKNVVVIFAVNNCAATTVTLGLIVYPYPGSSTVTSDILPSVPILTVALAVVPPPYSKLPGMSAGGGSISKNGLW